jgi:hypothetical protein
MIGIDDIEISRRVRAVLANNWIDLGKITICTVRGAVYVRGVLAQIQQPAGTLDAACVDTIVDELKRIDGVERLSLILDNWREAAGHWEEANAG